MLSHLSVNNVVLIDKLVLQVDSGFTALTGETGAGKSILLDALGLAIGGRAESRLVTKGQEKASVVASFDLLPDHPINALLDDNDIEKEDQLLLKRVLNADGKSKAFINDQPTSVTLLKEIGEMLVEIHGQHETRGLLDANTHRGILDAYAGIESQLEALSNLWDEWQGLEKKIAQIQAEFDQAQQEEEYLKTSLEDLEKLDPQSGEEAILTEQRAILMNSEQILQAFKTVYDAISSEEGAESRINIACRALEKIADKAGERVNGLVDQMDRSLSELREVVISIESLSAEIGAEGKSLEEVDERLHALRGQARKHHCFIDDLPEKMQEIAEKLELIADQDGSLDKLEKQRQQAFDAYKKLAGEISDKREQAAAKFSSAVNAELAPLKLEKAEIFVQVEELAEEEWTRNGMDKIRFTVSTNPGQEPGPLHKIASGGELSRFMLAFKVVMADIGAHAVMIFDEIDAGVGGSTADAIGDRLSQLAQNKQLLVVTHSPQVASCADHHWIISKAAGTEGQMTTKVTPLEGQEQRREEIARMLAGAQVTDEARAAANKLLEQRKKAA